jgi:hypothetical protein
MESKKDALPEDEDSETDTQDNDDLLYTHKPEARGSEMRLEYYFMQKIRALSANGYLKPFTFFESICSISTLTRRDLSVIFK